MFFGKVVRTIPSISRTTCARCTATRAPSTPRANDSTCFTSSVPRCTLRSIVSTILRSSASSFFCDKSPTPIMIGASRLFMSCAIPPASVPMLSSRCARRNCSCNVRRSVMSATTVMKYFGSPAASRNSEVTTAAQNVVPLARTYRFSAEYTARVPARIARRASSLSARSSGAVSSRNVRRSSSSREWPVISHSLSFTRRNVPSTPTCAMPTATCSNVARKRSSLSRSLSCAPFRSVTSACSARFASSSCSVFSSSLRINVWL